MDNEKSVIWTPQPKQRTLIECPVFEVLFGGARGGGKTDGMLGDWYEHSNTYGRHATGMFFRRRFRQLSEVIARSKEIYKPLGAKYNEQKSEWTMPDGGRLLFRYLERDRDAEEYQGHNYTRLYGEEITNFPSPKPINLLRATLRSSVGVPVGFRSTANPGGPGHNWVKRRYIDPCPTGFKVIEEKETITLDGKTFDVSIDRVFIPSKLIDNEMLMRNDPSYILKLRQSGSEELVKAWLNGDWTAVEGVYFDEFNEEKHILPMDTQRLFPRDAIRFRAFDWGSAKPFSVGWYIVSDGTWGFPEHALIKYDEWYGASDDNVGLKMTADKVAQGILKREQKKGFNISYGAADPSIFIRDGGPSIAETMAIEGVQFKRADNRRIAGWSEMRRLLNYENSEPLLYFLECCDDSIRTIPSLQHDEDNPEDLDTEAEDHAADETRYAVMSRPWVYRAGKAIARPLPKLPQNYTINEIISRQRKKRLANRRQL